jgi:hypothetical protein
VSTGWWGTSRLATTSAGMPGERGGGGRSSGAPGAAMQRGRAAPRQPRSNQSIPLAKRFQPLRSGRSCAKKQWETPLVSAQDVEV